MLALACGGGGGGASSPAAPVTTWASTLAYTDPSGGGFRFVKNSTLSSPARLVLDLVGPTGQNGQGVAFILMTDASKVSWAQPPSSPGLVQNLAFNLGGGTPAQVGLDKGGGVLQGAIFQKSGSLALGQPLARVCLALKANAVNVNTSIGFTFTAGNILSDTGAVTPLSITTGSLLAQ